MQCQQHGHWPLARSRRLSSSRKKKLSTPGERPRQETSKTSGEKTDSRGLAGLRGGTSAATQRDGRAERERSSRARLGKRQQATDPGTPAGRGCRPDGQKSRCPGSVQERVVLFGWESGFGMRWEWHSQSPKACGAPQGHSARQQQGPWWAAGGRGEGWRDKRH